MPYESTKDLPEAQTKKYSGNQKRAFMHAFNSQLERGLPESRAFATAHTAAKRAHRGKAKRHQ